MTGRGASRLLRSDSNFDSHDDTKFRLVQPNTFGRVWIRGIFRVYLLECINAQVMEQVACQERILFSGGRYPRHVNVRPAKVHFRAPKNAPKCQEEFSLNLFADTRRIFPYFPYPSALSSFLGVRTESRFSGSSGDASRLRWSRFHFWRGDDASNLVWV